MLITNNKVICISCAIFISISFIYNIFFIDKQMNTWSLRQCINSWRKKIHPKFVQYTYCTFVQEFKFWKTDGQKDRQDT